MDLKSWFPGHHNNSFVLQMSSDDCFFKKHLSYMLKNSKNFCKNKLFLSKFDGEMILRSLSLITNTNIWPLFHNQWRLKVTQVEAVLIDICCVNNGRISVCDVKRVGCSDKPTESSAVYYSLLLNSLQKAKWILDSHAPGGHKRDFKWPLMYPLNV